MNRVALENAVLFCSFPPDKIENKKNRARVIGREVMGSCSEVSKCEKEKKKCFLRNSAIGR